MLSGPEIAYNGPNAPGTKGLPNKEAVLLRKVGETLREGGVGEISWTTCEAGGDHAFIQGLADRTGVRTSAHDHVVGASDAVKTGDPKTTMKVLVGHDTDQGLPVPNQPRSVTELPESSTTKVPHYMVSADAEGNERWTPVAPVTWGGTK